MNTDKTLNEKFLKRTDYPIWYYKELQAVGVDHVIWNLLKEPFVVEIDGAKHEITFGKNRKGEIGQCIRYDEMNKNTLTSYSVVEKGFREGKWFVITDTDTSEKSKVDYIERKTQYEREEMKKWYKKILGNVIRDNDGLSIEQSNSCLQEIENSTYEELEHLVKKLMKNLND